MMQYRTRFAAMAVAILLATCPARAELKAEILDFGLTTGRRVQTNIPPQPGEVGLSPSARMANIKHLVQTDKIEARRCRSFGVTVRLSPDSPDQMPQHVDVRTDHPTLTRPDGVSGRLGRFRSEVVDGTTYAGFSFDYDWEMQPGTWTFTLSVSGVEIARKSFTITTPSSGGSKSECWEDTVS